MKIFQTYIKLRDKIHNFLEIRTNEPIVSVLTKNTGKLLLILLTLGLAILAIFVAFKNLLVLGSLFAVAVGAILYGTNDKIFYDELFFTIGIPITILNFLIGFIKLLIYLENLQLGNPTGSVWTIVTAGVFMLFGILIIMTSCSRDHIEIINEEN